MSDRHSNLAEADAMKSIGLKVCVLLSDGHGNAVVRSDRTGVYDADCVDDGDARARAANQAWPQMVQTKAETLSRKLPMAETERPAREERAHDLHEIAETQEVAGMLSRYAMGDGAVRSDRK